MANVAEAKTVKALKTFKTSLEIRLQNRERSRRFREKSRAISGSSESIGNQVFTTFNWMSFNTSDVFIEELLRLGVRFIVFQREACYLRGYCELFYQKRYSAIRVMFMDPELLVMTRVGSRLFAINLATAPASRLAGPWSSGEPVSGRGMNHFPYQEQKEENDYLLRQAGDLVWLLTKESRNPEYLLDE